MILITGGAGFIGSTFARDWFNDPATRNEDLINLDAMTYAGNIDNLTPLINQPKHIFVRGDICDSRLLRQLLSHYKPRAVVHFAAESHVDRSINGPLEFIRTNVEGTYSLLEEVRKYWSQLPSHERDKFRFHHVSTDEVYGSLSPEEPAFAETHRYEPNSPYSASKAASDHLVRAWHKTYGLPVVVTNCSNNYGPYQFPEKLIPLVITNALAGKALPIYGDGNQIRDWLYVRDHCVAIRMVLAEGTIGETYNIGGENQRTNVQIVKTICELLDERRPDPAGAYSRLIDFVKDRPGHDRRYAINSQKIKEQLGWQAIETFETGIRKTVDWYINHLPWVERIRSGSYRDGLHSNLGDK